MRSPVAGAFLDGVNGRSPALMVVVTWELSHVAIVDVTTIVLAGRERNSVASFPPQLRMAVLVGVATGALPIATTNFPS